MKKTEVVSLIAEKLGVSKAEASRRLEGVDAIVEAVVDGLEVGAKAKIGDYITVEKKEVAARICRNPKTGEEVQKEAGVKVVIKATAAAKNL